jgi:hypothetical protein
MHYFTNADGLTATCEDVNAARIGDELEARGFQRCTHAAWAAARAEQDRLTRLAGDIHPPSFVASQDEPVVVTSPPPAVALPKVYASSWGKG